MKRKLFFAFLCLMSIGAFAQYVDLGLPSGTKWKSTNEPGYYTYDQAVSKFGSSLPTKEQMEEFKYCEISRMSNGTMIVGPNGNYIFLSSDDGYCECDGTLTGVGSAQGYWTSTPYGTGRVTSYGLACGNGEIDFDNYERCYGFSVRLVKK
jgi:hypothetical protein